MWAGQPLTYAGAVRSRGGLAPQRGAARPHRRPPRAAVLPRSPAIMAVRTRCLPPASCRRTFLNGPGIEDARADRRELLDKSPVLRRLDRPVLGRRIATTHLGSEARQCTAALPTFFSSWLASDEYLSTKYIPDYYSTPINGRGRALLRCEREPTDADRSLRAPIDIPRRLEDESELRIVRYRCANSDLDQERAPVRRVEADVHGFKCHHSDEEHAFRQ